MGSVKRDIRRKFRNLNQILLALTFIVIFSVVLFYPNHKEFIIESIADEEVSLKDGLKLLVKCVDKSFDLEKIQDGSYWILKNYIRADHGELSCGDGITYTTHGDFTFFDNLPVLVPRWRAPVSFALFAPGADFNKTLESIQYVRNCLPESDMIRFYVTFHIYFENKHMPASIPITEMQALQWPYNCSAPGPYENVNRTEMYRYESQLVYPINVGRNIARKAAITYFILASDIELYPNPGFVDQFIEMVMRNNSILSGPRPKVFALAVFELNKSANIPDTKTELQLLLKKKTAIPFHKFVCTTCHYVPNITEWMDANETDTLEVFSVGERKANHKYWEPFYVSDNQEPLFDERVTWEGQKNKRIQSYAMCLLNYEFHVLNNAFLVHNPGIKKYKRDPVRENYVRSMNELIRKEIIPEYRILFGKQQGCIP